MTKMIWAESDGGVIGRDGGLPWHLPEDMAWFKALTLDETIIMGERTEKSVGDLPRRRVIIWDGYDPEEMLGEIVEDVWICGGAHTYESFMPYVTKLYITCILENFKGDTYAPNIPERFKKVWATPELVAKNGIHYVHEIHSV